MLDPVVVKVGGSLFDLPDLGARLCAWLNGLPVLRTPYSVLRTPVLLVPGGGATADVIRRLDQIHALGEERAHWLALRSLTLNAHFLASLLPDAVVAGGASGNLAVLDAHAFAVADEDRPGRLPHTWNVTSDSLAARAADVNRARQLILLKSVTIPPGLDWAEAGQGGFVDRRFAQVLSWRATPFDVITVNLREWQPPPVAG
jgi:hypothetical protein